VKNFAVEPDRVDLPPGATAGAPRTWVKWRGRAITALSENAYRAYLYPVFTPSGVSVTAESPIDHPHHNSVTVGTDHFDCLFVYDGDRIERGTYNFYVNDTFQGRTPGRIAPVSLESNEVSDNHLRSVQHLEWQGPIEWGAPDRRVLARETRTIDIRPGETSNVIDIHCRLEPTDWDIVVGPTRHAYFTVRMADGLRVVDGGTIIDAGGHSTMKDINNHFAEWVDLTANGPHGHKVGVTIVPRPSRLPTAWYAHEWGSVAVNPFLTGERSLSKGDHLVLGISLIVHDGPLDHTSISTVYDSLRS
jgi:hypothetical protein